MKCLVLDEAWVFRQIVGQRSWADTHELGGVSFDTRYFKRLANRLAFDPLDVLPQLQRRYAGRAHARRRLNGECRTSNRRAGRQDDGALDRVFELTHVAWPVMLQERRDHAVLQRHDRPAASP